MKKSILIATVVFACIALPSCSTTGGGPSIASLEAEIPTITAAAAVEYLTSAPDAATRAQRTSQLKEAAAALSIAGNPSTANITALLNAAIPASADQQLLILAITGAYDLIAPNIQTGDLGVIAGDIATGINTALSTDASVVKAKAKARK